MENKISNDSLNEAAKIFKVLSNSKRISILFLLRTENKELNVSEIVKKTNLAQPIVSKQLNILAKYQLVNHHKHGTHVFYSLNDEDIIDLIDSMIKHISHSLNHQSNPKNLF